MECLQAIYSWTVWWRAELGRAESSRRKINIYVYTLDGKTEWTRDYSIISFVFFLQPRIFLSFLSMRLKVFCCQLFKLNLKLTTIQGNARALLPISVELLQSKIAIQNDLSLNPCPCSCIWLVFGCSNVYSVGMTRINMRDKQMPKSL